MCSSSACRASASWSNPALRTSSLKTRPTRAHALSCACSAGETSDKENEFKLTALLLAALLLISLLTACGQKQAETEPTGDQLARIQQSGTIIVAMEGTWAPWTYHDKSDTLAGYDVDVARAIAEQLGVEVTFVEGDDSAALLAAINDALAKLSADGTLSELSTKYFGMDITKDNP